MFAGVLPRATCAIRVSEQELMILRPSKKRFVGLQKPVTWLLRGFRNGFVSWKVCKGKPAGVETRPSRSIEKPSGLLTPVLSLGVAPDFVFCATGMRLACNWSISVCFRLCSGFFHLCLLSKRHSTLETQATCLKSEKKNIRRFTRNKACLLEKTFHKGTQTASQSSISMPYLWGRESARLA